MTDQRNELPVGYAAVITMDQRRSRARADLVTDALPLLNQRHREALVRPFVRTAGDEIQAVVRGLNALVDLILDDAGEPQWWIGIGIGTVEPLAETASASRGEAFYRARAAVETSKRRPWGFALHGPQVWDRVELALIPLSFIIRHRTTRQQQAVDAYRTHTTARAAAEALGISASTFSESLRRAGAAEETAGRRLVASLLPEMVGE